MFLCVILSGCLSVWVSSCQMFLCLLKYVSALVSTCVPMDLSDVLPVCLSECLFVCLLVCNICIVRLFIYA